MICQFCDGRGCLGCNGLGRAILPSEPTDTQQAAADSLDPVRLRQQTAAILEALEISGGLTDEGIYVTLDEHGVPISHNGHRARRVELERAGYVARSDRRDTTSTGRAAIVWVITDAGARALHAYQREVTA
jgi:hypothetical protein